MNAKHKIGAWHDILCIVAGGVRTREYVTSETSLLICQNCFLVIWNCNIWNMNVDVPTTIFGIDRSEYRLSQWEPTLHCKVVPHWLSPYPGNSLFWIMCFEYWWIAGSTSTFYTEHHTLPRISRVVHHKDVVPYQYRNSHHKCKAAVKPSYFCNVNPYARGDGLYTEADTISLSMIRS